MDLNFSKLTSDELELPAVTIVTLLEPFDPNAQFTGIGMPGVQLYRIEWNNAHQYRTWYNETPEIRGCLIYIEGDNRLPNVQMTTVVGNHMEVKYAQIDAGRMRWWMAKADIEFPMYTGQGAGRPQVRALEALTTRQRRARPFMR